MSNGTNAPVCPKRLPNPPHAPSGPSVGYYISRYNHDYPLLTLRRRPEDLTERYTTCVSVLCRCVSDNVCKHCPDTHCQDTH